MWLGSLFDAWLEFRPRPACRLCQHVSWTVFARDILFPSALPPGHPREGGWRPWLLFLCARVTLHAGAEARDLGVTPWGAGTHSRLNSAWLASGLRCCYALVLTEYSRSNPPAKDRTISLCPEPIPYEQIVLYQPPRNGVLKGLSLLFFF